MSVPSSVTRYRWNDMPKEPVNALLERRLNEITVEADRLTGYEATEPAPLRETARHERAS